jgi:hypothetical protein
MQSAEPEHVSHPKFSREQLDGQRLGWLIGGSLARECLLKADKPRQEDGKYVLWASWTEVYPSDSKDEGIAALTEESLDQTCVTKIEAVESASPLGMRGFRFAIVEDPQSRIQLSVHPC